jgi:hypothetical protein
MARDNIADVIADLDDNALFAAAIAPDPDTPPQIQGDQPPPEEAGSTDEPRSVPPQEVRDPPDDGGDAPAPTEEYVPSWRLREEREAREAYAGRLAERDRQLGEALNFIRQQQAREPLPAPPPPDPLLDPAAFHRSNADTIAGLATQFRNELRTVQLENNLQLTRVQVGPELFDAAYTAFCETAAGDQGFARAVVAAPNPGAAMVNWYRQASTLDRIGGDPEAWFNQRRSELLQDPEFLAEAVEAARNYRPPAPSASASNASASNAMPAASRGMRGAPSSNVTVLPPSLMRMRGSGTTENTAANIAGDADPLSDQSLFAFATKAK